MFALSANGSGLLRLVYCSRFNQKVPQGDESRQELRFLLLLIDSNVLNKQITREAQQEAGNSSWLRLCARNKSFAARTIEEHWEILLRFVWLNYRKEKNQLRESFTSKVEDWCRWMSCSRTRMKMRRPKMRWAQVEIHQARVKIFTRNESLLRVFDWNLFNERTSFTPICFMVAVIMIFLQASKLFFSVGIWGECAKKKSDSGFWWKSQKRIAIVFVSFSLSISTDTSDFVRSIHAKLLTKTVQLRSTRSPSSQRHNPSWDFARLSIDRLIELLLRCASW